MRTPSSWTGAAVARATRDARGPRGARGPVNRHPEVSGTAPGPHLRKTDAGQPHQGPRHKGRGAPTAASSKIGLETDLAPFRSVPIEGPVDAQFQHFAGRRNGGRELLAWGRAATYVLRGVETAPRAGDQAPDSAAYRLMERLVAATRCA